MADIQLILTLIQIRIGYVMMNYGLNGQTILKNIPVFNSYLDNSGHIN